MQKAAKQAVHREYDQRSYRMTSIDMLRGLIILIMPLDHVRDFVMLGGPPDFMADPHVSPILFFSRWISHFCAPVFVLLAGVSAGLMTARKTPMAMAAFLLKRGLWIIFVEVAIISTAFTFSPFGLDALNGKILLVMQVMWAIGASMLVLSAAQFLGMKTCLVMGGAIVLTHNLLDVVWPHAGMSVTGMPLWVALHAQMASGLGPFQFRFVYPLLPWIGVMLLGYGVTPVFQALPDNRHRKLFRIGLALTAAFIVLRAIDMYGDPQPWQVQDSGSLATVLSFLNVTKYPPSLLYLLMTLGPAALLCSYADRFKGWFKDTLVMYGRVPFAFYVAHFYLAHAIGVAVCLYHGYTLAQMMTFFRFYPKGFGLSLFGVYVVWLFVIVALYPFCRWVAGVKARRRDWWLSYL